jgi:RNA polymerase primary sigma factor
VCTAERTHGLSAAAIVELDRCVTRERHRIETAKHRFIEANLRLVLSIARRYHARGFDFLDLVQEGNIGLMRAVDRFDHRYGFRFSSYAVRVICQSVRSAIHARGSLVRLPAQLSDRLPEVTAATRRLRHALERVPDAQEVADAACVPVECVRELETCMDQPVSLDARIADDDDSTLVAYLPDSDAIDLVDAVCDLDVNQRIEAALEELGEREQRILRMRFGLGTAASLDHSLEQVGRCFGISRERIRQVEGAALRKLRAQATRRGRRQKRKG